MTTPRGPFYAPAISPAQERLRRAVESDQPEEAPQPPPVYAGLPDAPLPTGLPVNRAIFQAGFPLGVAQRTPAVPPPDRPNYFAKGFQEAFGGAGEALLRGVGAVGTGIQKVTQPFSEALNASPFGGRLSPEEMQQKGDPFNVLLAGAAPGVLPSEYAAAINAPFSAALRGLQAAPQAAARAAVRVPVRPVQEAGLRLAGVEPVAGAAEEPLDTLASFDRAIKRSEAAAKTLRESGVPESASASLQDHIQGLRDMRAGHIQTALSPEDYGRYQELQDHLDELQAIKESKVGGGSNKAPNFGSPERVAYDELRAYRRLHEGFQYPSSATRAAAARRDLLETRREIADLERQVDAAPVAEGVPGAAPTLPGGQIQAGMGIGEKPQQGTLLGEFQGKEAPAIPLIDQERIQAQQARAAEVARGQGELPTSTVRRTPIKPLPTSAAMQEEKRLRQAFLEITSKPKQQYVADELKQAQMMSKRLGMPLAPTQRQTSAKAYDRAVAWLANHPEAPPAPLAESAAPGATLERGAGAPPVPSLPPATERPPAPPPSVAAAGQAPPPEPAAAVPEAAGAAPPPQPPSPPVSTPPAGAAPLPPPANLPPTGPNNPIGLRDIAPGLTREQELRNVARRLVSKFSAGFVSPIEDNPASTAAMTERARVRPIISSVANALGTSAEARVNAVFEIDKHGGITALAGVDPTIRGVPTITDVAARLPVFESSLSAEQKAALDSLRRDVEPYSAMLKSKGVDFGSRADVIPGGFYLPRGRADIEGADLPIKVRTSTGAGGGKRGFERPAVFPSQAEGIAKGYSYAPFGEALTSYARDAGSRATEAHVAAYFKGLPEAQTLKPGESVPRDRQMIGLPGIQGYTYPDEIANAANKVQNSEGQTRGALSPIVNTANAFNNLYRGMRATLDDSALGVQALLGLGGDQKAYYAALKLNLRAWGTAGDAALGRFLVDFDQHAAADGALTSQQWARAGLHIGGATSEFQVGQGVGKLSTAIQNLPVIRVANRAFGYTGDGLRAQWAQDALKGELSNGRTLAEVISSGDAERIAKSINGATGWAEGKAFGSLGDLALFAPKFLQSRVETVVRGAAGLRPGATLDQRIARNSLLKLIGGATLLTVAANYAQGKETDFRPIVNGRRNGNFLRINYQGNNYSLLGTWDSLAGGLINVATLHPQNALRGLGSGIVSDAWDLISGKDYNRNPTRDTPADFAKWLLNSMAPFSSGQAGQGISQAVSAGAQGDIPKAIGGGVNAVSQITGFKSFPVNNLYAAQQTWERDLQPYLALPTNPIEARAKNMPTRDEYRGQHPDVDAKLFLSGQGVTAVKTQAAREEVVRLMRQYGLTPADVKSIQEKPYESRARTRLRDFLLSQSQTPSTEPTAPTERRRRLLEAVR